MCSPRSNTPSTSGAATEARAALDQARAKLKLSEAAVQSSAEADRVAAAAVVTQSEAEITKLTAFPVYRKKERDRIADLVAQAVEQRLLDEQEDQLQSAIGGEQAGIAAVATARQVYHHVNARSSPRLGPKWSDPAATSPRRRPIWPRPRSSWITRRSSRRTMPVVTLRSFHNGDFIRSASDGGNTPVLSVACTDLMHVVMLVPDLDVPFVNRGDPVTIQVDALGGQVFWRGRGQDGEFRKRTETHADQPRRALRSLSVDLALELGDPQLLLRDQRHVFRSLRASDRQLSLDCEFPRAFGGKRRLQRGDVVGQSLASRFHETKGIIFSANSRRPKMQVTPCFSVCHG